MKIGARIHDLFITEHTAFADRLRLADVECVQLAMSKFFTGYDFWADDYNEGAASAIFNQISKTPVRVSVLSSYINPVGGDVRKNIGIFKKHVDYALAIGASMVATETGSVVDDFLNNYLPNRTQEVFDRLVASLGECIEYAEGKGVTVGIECVYCYPLHSAETLAKFIKAVNAKNIAVVFDPVNLLTPQNYANQNQIFSGFIDLHGDKIKVLHLKDFVIDGGAIKYVPLYEGLLNLDLIISLLDSRGIDCDIILEEVNQQTYQKIKERLKKDLNKGDRLRQWKSDKV